VLRQFSGTKRSNRRATTSSDFWAMLLPEANRPGDALLIATNHWSVSIGSITALVRSPRGTVSLCGLVAAEQAELLEIGDDARRASERSRPR
jgi:hypothetical protein